MNYFKNFPTVDYDVIGEGDYDNVVELSRLAAVTAQLEDEVAFYSYYHILDGERPDNVSQKLYGTPIYYWTFFVVNPELSNYYETWPKGTDFMREYVKSRYNTTCGVVLPQALKIDYIHGRFIIGETIRGSLSGATGTLIAKYPSLGFIEMDDVQGTFAPNEALYGLQSQDSITAKVGPKYEAPHHYVNPITGEIQLRDANAVPVSIYEWEQEQDIERARIRVIKPEHIRRVADEYFRELNK